MKLPRVIRVKPHVAHNLPGVLALARPSGQIPAVEKLDPFAHVAFPFVRAVIEACPQTSPNSPSDRCSVRLHHPSSPATCCSETPPEFKLDNAATRPERDT